MDIPRFDNGQVLHDIASCPLTRKAFKMVNRHQRYLPIVCMQLGLNL